MTEYEAGWYPQEDGRLRYYDGSRWTDHFHDSNPKQETTNHRASDAVSQAAAQFRELGKAAFPSDALWSATGKSMTGIVTGRYWLTPKFLFFERGLLRTDSQQVPISAVVDVDVRQSMGQKARGVYSVIVHIQRAASVERVPMDDIPDGRAAQTIINETAHEARVAIQRATNTQTVRHEGSPPFAHQTAAPVAAEAPREDLIAMLRQLGELRDAGILSEAEFESKKKSILDRI